MSQYDMEEQMLEEQYERGEISAKEYSQSLRELQREARWQAQEAAQQAYDDEMDRW
jgi:competence protein ComGC